MATPDRMTCEEVFARLEDFVDRELSPDEMRRVQEHLDACAACAAEHRFEASVIRGLREKLQRIDLPQDLLARISRRLREEG
ncbi:MAG TPA: zf-HC2 domain-containing protein [Gemmatimonadales bacterium]|nr:zf-HC2 domain-containing protein [Gemmatimonadales bacterium]